MNLLTMDHLMDYIHRLPEDTDEVNISFFNQPELPDLSRFHNMSILLCYGNQLTSIPILSNLVKLMLSLIHI